MISAVIITKNEAHNIERAIHSLKSLVEEIVIVDTGSEDGTVEIAQSLGISVIGSDWNGYGPTKNFANRQAKNDWILSLDADEEISEALSATIKSLNLNPEIQYKFRIVMNFLGKELRFTEYEPHYKPRLFHRDYYDWDERVVHEKLKAKAKPTSKNLKGDLLHYSFKDLAHYKHKLDLYAQLSAQEWIRKGKTPGLIKRVLGPFYRFFRSYILKLGILEGKEGWLISAMAGRLVKERHRYFDLYKKGTPVKTR